LKTFDGYVERYLKLRPDKKRPKGMLYVTDLTKECIKNAYHSIVDGSTYPIDTLRIFESGNMIEDWWTKVLEQDPTINVIGTQVKCYHVDREQNIEIHGRLDILCQHNNSKLVAHEVKSNKSNYYLKDKPKDAHYQQLQFYLNSLGLDFGWVDYLDKTVMLSGGEAETKVDKCFLVERNYEVFASMVQRAKELNGYLQTNDPPAQKGWLCDYCQYVGMCKNG